MYFFLFYFFENIFHLLIPHYNIIYDVINILIVKIKKNSYFFIIIKLNYFSFFNKNINYMKGKIHPNTISKIRKNKKTAKKLQNLLQGNKKLKNESFMKQFNNFE